MGTTVPKALVASALLVAAVGGCGGGGESDREQMEGATLAYLAALRESDGPGACRLLSARGRQVIRTLSDRLRPGDCESIVTEIGRRSAIPSALRVTKIDVSGDGATVEVAGSAYQSGLLFEREGDDWKIAYPPAVAQRFDTPPGVPSHR